MTEPRCWGEGCAHAQKAHKHYRPGTDCSLCDCDGFQGGPVLLRLRQWIQNWLIADRELSAVYAAADVELSRQEGWRLDTRDGVFAGLPCWEKDPDSPYHCTARPVHGGQHVAEDGDGNLVAVWGDDRP